MEEFLKENNLSELPVSVQRTYTDVQKKVMCEEAPQILCIHINHVLEQDLYSFGRKKQISFSQTLEFGGLVRGNSEKSKNFLDEYNQTLFSCYNSLKITQTN